MGAPARITVRRAASGRWVVMVNKRVWLKTATRDEAEAEADWLRWPRHPPRYVADGAA